jgi:hypothetical protein
MDTLAAGHAPPRYTVANQSAHGGGLTVRRTHHIPHHPPAPAFLRPPARQASGHRVDGDSRIEANESSMAEVSRPDSATRPRHLWLNADQYDPGRHLQCNRKSSGEDLVDLIAFFSILETFG